MIEGSGSGSRAGSIPLTSGSGSGRPKACGSGSGTLGKTGKSLMRDKVCITKTFHKRLFKLLTRNTIGTQENCPFELEKIFTVEVLHLTKKSR
jgi:hypothetical protein